MDLLINVLEERLLVVEARSNKLYIVYLHDAEVCFPSKMCMNTILLCWGVGWWGLLTIDISQDSSLKVDCTYQSLVFNVILIDYVLIRYTHGRRK